MDLTTKRMRIHTNQIPTGAWGTINRLCTDKKEALGNVTVLFCLDFELLLLLLHPPPSDSARTMDKNVVIKRHPKR